MTPKEKDAIVEKLQAALQAIAYMPTATPCKRCDHWIENSCHKWGATPPLEAQATGCDEFVDEVPF